MENQEDIIILDDVDTNAEPALTETQVESKDTQEQSQPQHSESELKAIEQGWNPDKDAYEKANPGKKWRPAEDYIERGELYDTIHNLKRSVEGQKEKFEALEKTYQKVREHTKAQVEKDLRKQLREASDIGDIEAVNRITDEIVNVKTQSDDGVADKKANPNNLPEPVVQEIRAFEQRNSHWFTRDPLDYEKFAVSSDAFQYEDMLARTRPDLPLPQRFEIVEKYIKAKYPNKFFNPKQNQPSTVASATSVATPAKKEIKISDLPQHHQRVIRTLKPETQKQYIADLKAIGEI